MRKNEYGEERTFESTGAYLMVSDWDEKVKWQSQTKFFRISRDYFFGASIVQHSEGAHPIPQQCLMRRRAFVKNTAKRRRSRRICMRSPAALSNRFPSRGERFLSLKSIAIPITPERKNAAHREVLRQPTAKEKPQRSSIDAAMIPSARAICECPVTPKTPSAILPTPVSIALPARNLLAPAAIMMRPAVKPTILGQNHLLEQQSFCIIKIKKISKYSYSTLCLWQAILILLRLFFCMHYILWKRENL